MSTARAGRAHFHSTIDTEVMVLGQGDGGDVLSCETGTQRLVEAPPMREIEAGEIFCLGGDVPASTFIEPKAKRPRLHLGPRLRRPLRHGALCATPRRVLWLRRPWLRPGRRSSLSQTAGRAAPLGVTEASSLHFEMGLIRSHYAGRMFIALPKSIPQVGVTLKLSPVVSVIKVGRSMVVVDDSLVRGASLQKIIGMLREARSFEVHTRMACPPPTHALAASRRRRNAN